MVTKVAPVQTSMGILTMFGMIFLIADSSILVNKRQKVRAIAIPIVASMFVVSTRAAQFPRLTTNMDATIGMAIALVFCLLFTNMLLSAMRNIIPNMVRIPIEVCTGATFVTIVDLFLHGTFPVIWALLGIYLPLITVN